MQAVRLKRGYGLFLVQRSLEKLRGSIEILSESGEGTTFKVEFPYQSKSEVVKDPFVNKMTKINNMTKCFAR